VEVRKIYNYGGVRMAVKKAGGAAKEGLLLRMYEGIEVYDG
jgi:hypothetical protein